MSSVWKFDQTIAKKFVGHARQHIPNYDAVIGKAVDVCRYLLPNDARIIDVGCATGQTLNALSSAGFTNLVGVDSSADMLAQCHAPAELILSDHLPSGPYHAVICNWTLHFMRDKIAYLKDIYDSLEPGGVLFLSDKTSKNSLGIHFYHSYKKQQGVTEEEIQLKAQSVESIMHIDPPTWYLKTLSDLRFRDIQIADANWCFTTFVCMK